MSEKAACNDCGTELPGGEGAIKGEDLRHGVYYHGDPICGRCCRDRREAYLAARESEGYVRRLREAGL